MSMCVHVCISVFLTLIVTSLFIVTLFLVNFLGNKGTTQKFSYIGTERLFS